MSRILALIVCCALFLSTSAFAETLELRRLKPLIDELVNAKHPDVGELAYANARGSAVFAAISMYLKENAQREQDRELSEQFAGKAVMFIEVASLLGEMTGKSKEATREQVKGLARNYLERMIASKQLNNEIITPEIREDMEAVKALEVAMTRMLDKLDANFAKSK
jgi:hypothetical protein